MAKKKEVKKVSIDLKLILSESEGQTKLNTMAVMEKFNYSNEQIRNYKKELPVVVQFLNELSFAQGVTINELIK